VPRSVLLGRVVAKGEPLFLPDDTAGALELQADEDARCPRGHYLDEAHADVDVSSFTCEGCAAEDSAQRAMRREVEGHGPDAADLLDGRYFTSRIDYQEA
jgi:hypothetical protein